MVRTWTVSTSLFVRISNAEPKKELHWEGREDRALKQNLQTKASELGLSSDALLQDLPQACFICVAWA